MASQRPLGGCETVLQSPGEQGCPPAGPDALRMGGEYL